jgi:O-antigen/teichoic acid export membrane protein
MMVIGSAQAVNILISILRIKVLALLLGPAGIGLLSIYNSLQGMVSTAAGLGMDSSGVRQIASVKGEEQALSRVRRVLLAAHFVQGALAMVGVWLLRAPIAEWILGDRVYSTEVGLIGVAILMGLLGTAQTALLQGMRRVSDLGRVTVLSALAGTVAGLSAVWLYGEAGLIWFVVVLPLAKIVIARRYTSRLPKPTTARPSAIEIWKVWKPMAKLGSAFMLAALATTATLLYTRSSIVHNLGIDAAGQFAAAWGLAVTYIGFFLGAMGADFYPRLTEVIRDRQITNKLVNDQAQLGLAIGGPLILLMIGMAPWIIRLLYSSEFDEAAGMLQLQMLGNVIKIVGFPLGYMFVAAARSKLYLFTQLNWNAFFLFMVWYWLPQYGLVAIGVAFSTAYVLNFTIANIFVRRLHGFRWESLSLLLLAMHAALALGLLLVAQIAPHLAAIASPFLALATGVIGLRVVLIKIASEGRIAARFASIYAAIGWPIRSI